MHWKGPAIGSFFIPLVRRSKMGQFKTSKVITPENALESPEEWDYFADLELMKSRGSSAFKTCEYFTYAYDKHESLF